MVISVENEEMTFDQFEKGLLPPDSERYLIEDYSYAEAMLLAKSPSGRMRLYILRPAEDRNCSAGYLFFDEMNGIGRKIYYEIMGIGSLSVIYHRQQSDYLSTPYPAALADSTLGMSRDWADWLGLDLGEYPLTRNAAQGKEYLYFDLIKKQIEAFAAGPTKKNVLKAIAFTFAAEVVASISSGRNAAFDMARLLTYNTVLSVVKAYAGNPGVLVTRYGEIRNGYPVLEIPGLYKLDERLVPQKREAVEGQ